MNENEEDDGEDEEEDDEDALDINIVSQAMKNTNEA